MAKNHRLRRTALSLALLALLSLLSLLALLPAQPVSAQEFRWVLAQTLVNPQKLPLEYHGGGSNPAFFPEERFKDMFVIYSVSATSFTVRDHWQDREYVAWDITMTSDFDAPKTVLVPGKPYELTVDFSHGGMVNDLPLGESFNYYSPSASIAPKESLVYSPWLDPGGVNSKTWTLTVPEPRAGDTLEIQAAMSAGLQCTVIWTYKAEIAAPGTTTTRPSATTSTSVASQEDTGTRIFTEEDFERMKADTAAYATSFVGPDYEREMLKQGYVGIVVEATGDYSVHDYAGRRMRASMPRYTAEGVVDAQLISIGDLVQTGTSGSVSVQMFTSRGDNDNDEQGVIIGLAGDGELGFWDMGFEEDRKPILEILRGTLRAIRKGIVHGWMSSSIFSVKAGTTICGGRGTDVLILHDPATDLVATSVLEGPVDVTNSLTGETESLTNNQFVLSIGGESREVRALSQEDWDYMMDVNGLGDLQPLSIQAVEQVDRAGDRPAINIALRQAGDPPVVPTESTESAQAGDLPVVPAETARTTGGSAVPLVIGVCAAVIAVAAMGVGIYLLRRSRRRAAGEAAPSADAPGASPGFCRQCGSAVTPGSPFCGGCGRKL